MIKIKEIMDSVKSAPKDFPVETAMGLTFSVASILGVEDVIKVFTPLPFAFVIFVAAITLHKINKTAYYASYFLIWLTYALFNRTHEIVEKPWFVVLNIIAAIVLAADLKKSDNKDFANTVIFRFGHIVTAGFLSGILALMVSAIIGSVIYLFDVDLWHLMAHVNILIFFLIMPLIYCNFQANYTEGDNYDSRLLRVLVDFIVSPALVIYTFILLVYILKIVFVQELPRGGVAYMVSIFIALVMTGNLLNKLVKDSHFNWFYDNFTYIAIAPIVLLWVGTIYRINEYGLTEWRVYLVILNVLMTLFPLMLKIPALARYNLMTIVLMAAMVLFTCIKPISANSIGIRSQYNRFVEHASAVGAFDTSNWTLRDDIDTIKIEQDSALNAQYRMMRREYEFLLKHCDSIRDKYDMWAYWNSIPDGKRPAKNVPPDWIYLSEHIDAVPLDGFGKLHVGNLNMEYDDGMLSMERNGKIILEYHIQDSLKSVGAEFYKNPLCAFKYHNDSVLVIIKEAWGWDMDGYFELDNINFDNIDVFEK